jgi:Zn-dependent protease
LVDILFDCAAWYVVFLFSLTFHEAAHSFIAMKLGDRTAYYGGQVTLNPVPHMKREPVGTIAVPLISFLLGGWMMGWASAPYDPLWAERHPQRAAWMAFAGPLSNLALVLASAFMVRIGIIAGIFLPPDSIRFTQVVEPSSAGIFSLFAIIISVMFSLNLILFVFNLLPLPPLDGFGALPLFIGEDSARRFQNVLRHPSFAFLGLFMAWKIFDVVFYPVHLAAINLLYPEIGYR